MANGLIRYLSSVVVLAAASFAQAQQEPDIADVMREDLLASTPTSLKVTAHALRNNLDLSEPGGMFSYVHGSRLLVQHALETAERHPGQAALWKAAIVPVTYNLAADTWSGWQDAFPTAGAYSLFGLEAARLNLALREELEQGPGRRARGHWLVGIHLLSSGSFDGAADAFAASRDLANEAGQSQDELMAQGWIHVANILAGNDERDELAAIKSRLNEGGERGTAFASQFDPALASLEQK